MINTSAEKLKVLIPKGVVLNGDIIEQWKMCYNPSVENYGVRGGFSSFRRVQKALQTKERRAMQCTLHTRI